MQSISIGQLLELYNDTINKCGLFLLDKDADTIQYYIYEDFDIGVHSFLHPENLKKLYDNRLISKNKLDKSVLLRNKVVDLQKTDEWGFGSFRTSEKWREILTLADEIRDIK